jgi:hypothetical protein
MAMISVSAPLQQQIEGTTCDVPLEQRYDARSKAPRIDRRQSFRNLVWPKMSCGTPLAAFADHRLKSDSTALLA